VPARSDRAVSQGLNLRRCMVMGRSLRHEFFGGQGWVTRRCGESTRIASETTQKQPCWRLQQYARLESTAPDRTGPDHRVLLWGSDETMLCFKAWYRNRGAGRAGLRARHGGGDRPIATRGGNGRATTCSTSTRLLWQFPTAASSERTTIRPMP
jgi:hypothetical protein